MSIVVRKASWLDTPMRVENLHGLTFTNERNAHEFVITCFQDGAELTLTGSITARFMRANNTTVLLGEGASDGRENYAKIEDGKATVLLHPDCYNVPGRFQLAVFHNQGDVTTCIYAAVGTVQRTEQGDLIDSGDIVPSIDELLEHINNCREATAAAEAAAQKSVRYDTAQTLTDAQKTVARGNISVPSEADVSQLKSAIDALGDPPKILEPEETEADLYVCDSNGNVIAKFVDGHIVTKNFDSASIQFDLIMEADSNEADLYISDSFGNVVAEFKDGHIVTKNFDSADMVDIPGYVSTLQTEVAALQSATSGILYRVKDQTDGVYAACRYHQPSSTSKQFCLLIAGDIHADGTRMQNMVEYLNAIDAFDAGIMLGDISGNQYSDTIAFYLDALENAQKPFLTVLGNHDVSGATSDSDLYTKFGDCFQYAQLASGEAVSGKCYYYKDFAAQKIRVIVLMQYDLAGRSSDTGDLCFGQDQINWFIGVLNSTPSDYGIIIAEHTNSSRYMTYNMDEKYTSSTWNQTNYAPTVMDGNPVPDIVNAWINGTTVSQTYNYTFSDPPTALSVSADFTSRGTGEFITYLGGHWHMDVLGTPTGYTNQPDYHIPAAGLGSATQGDIPRKTGTCSEDSLGAIAVDRNKKTVKVFHIGAHFTKDAVDRLYFKYSYGA